MALKDILKPVVAELVANNIIVDPTVHLGVTPKANKTAPPAIFWVPKRGIGSGPMMAMTRAAQLAFFAANPGKSIPRALHTRSIELEVHIWGGGHASTDDYSSTELMLDAVLSALHHQAYGVYKYISEEWLIAGTDITILGRRCVLLIQINVPVLETAPVVGNDAVVITGLPVTTQMGPISPGGTTVTNP